MQGKAGAFIILPSMKLSIVIPVKDQTAKLKSNLLEKGLPFFDSLGIAYDVIVVSDGSSKEEQASLERLFEEGAFPIQVHLLPYEDRKGKGAAIAHAFRKVDADYIMFMDADWATDPEPLKDIVRHLGEADCWIASRNAKGAKILTPQPLVRRILHAGSRFICRHRFGLTKLSDTQCGFKIFRGDLAEILSKKQIIMGPAFDVEYLYFLSLNGFSIREFPAVWRDDPDSTFTHPVKTALRFYRDLGRIKRNKKNYILTKEEKEALCSSTEPSSK